MKPPTLEAFTLVAGFDARKLSQRAVVVELNAVGVPAPRGGAWSLAQVQRMLKRLAAIQEGTRSVACKCPSFGGVVATQ